MKISSQEEYGLRCLIRLGTSAEGASISEIAEAEGLSIPYAAKLCGLLRQQGFIESTRGRSGGYKLAFPPSEIKLGALLTSLGDQLFDGGDFCKKHAGIEKNGQCVHHADCSLRSLWSTLDFWMQSTLNSLTLADLLDRQSDLEELLRIRLSAILQNPMVRPASLLQLKLSDKKPQSEAVMVLSGQG